jgi:hypothetical protein
MFGEIVPRQADSRRSSVTLLDALFVFPCVVLYYGTSKIVVVPTLTESESGLR